MRYDKPLTGFGNIPRSMFVWGKNTNNTWYVILRMRWIKKLKDLVCPYKFVLETHLSYLTYAWYIDTRNGIRIATNKIWVPMDDWEENKTEYYKEN